MANFYTPAERRLVNAYCPLQVVGDPRTVQARVEDRAEHATADETMVITDVHDRAERLRSYEELAEVYKESVQELSRR